MDDLIRLSPGRALPPFITDLTGITAQQLESEGVDPASLLLPLPAGLPLARTRCIGHQTDALAALLGAQLDCRDDRARLTAPCPALF